MKISFSFARRLPIALFAIATLAVVPAARPQEAAAGKAPPKVLYISILQGEGALNDVRARTAREPIVEVQDENHKPVAGALVLFFIHTNGSGGLNAAFSGGAQTLTATTDAEGRAVALGFHTTHATGKFHITVRAQAGQAQGQTVITQSNLLMITQNALINHIATWAINPPNWMVAATAAGGAAAVGTVLATLPSTVSITPGTGTVGAPPATAGVRLNFHRRNP